MAEETEPKGKARRDRRPKTMCTPQESQGIRLAMMEAVESVENSMRSFLPRDPGRDVVEEAELRKKWTERLDGYRSLLEAFGGKIRGERTSAEDLGNPK